MTIHTTADLAHFCASLQNEGIPAVVRERVRYLLLDHLAVTLRGSILAKSWKITLSIDVANVAYSMVVHPKDVIYILFALQHNQC
jgi:2-methylcitrate dehydratase PrpD